MRARDSVCMPSQPPTHSSWFQVAARVTPPLTRWPSGWRSAGPRTAEAAPEPRVSDANSSRYSARVMPSRCRCLTVFSRSAFVDSPATTIAYSIWPESIIAAAIVMPLTKPRHAFVTSKFIAWVPRPSSLWIDTATEGSIVTRDTEPLIMRPI